MSTPSPRRLTLSKMEYACLAGALDEVNMPVGWEPATDVEIGDAAADLVRRGVLRGSGDLVTVHPSIATNLRLLARPQVVIDTMVSVRHLGSRSLHAISGELGGSLFALGAGGIELSLFAAVDLGRELVRAVPPERTSKMALLLSGDAPTEAVHGRVPLEALEQLGEAALFDSTVDHLEGMNLAPEQRELARDTVGRSDGTLRCAMTGRTASGVRTSQLTWLHTDSGWVGIRPDPDDSGLAMVRLEPVTREDIGVWAAPFLAAVLS